ncbi:SO2930 family diheme c-type cytochrome [Thermoflexibacter ruber]|uniref:Uncharacterized protein n=1 Tax=Thermoflexibacter ruber TaxID=1003 RepID=A0A1I2EV57_9BACT|nr:SO2930 family diheme c-type cytochrome [Thermoflexibacter ruber]SFE96613.1 conserved hypothetical protein, HNE_0200 family [Thermoflexibacter ruber]
MKYRKIIFLASCVVFMLTAFKVQKNTKEVAVKEKLSDYGFFAGKLADLNPSEGVIPYQLNTPLFSDYAEKQRFIKLPSGTTAQFHAIETFQFPKGTVLIKNFYYPFDVRDKSKGRRILETRLLIHQEEGWVALPYIWNEEQTEAYLDVAGDTKEVSWKDEKGKKQVLQYTIPNVNQCKGCHLKDGKMTPIGLVARQLNGNFPYKEGEENQLLKWKKLGILENLPELSQVSQVPVWADANSGDLNSRARAWLDINCAFCHNPKGAASTSGLFLEYNQDNATALGIFKNPVAAGKGSGNRQFDIVPAQPDKSILVYRIESNDPSEMMPEIGRKVVHKEGVALIKEWIKQMK